MKIDIVGSGQIAGVDYDRLAIGGRANYLNAVDLEVDLQSGLDLLNDRLTILTFGLTSSNTCFHSVTFHGGYGDLALSSSCVTLSRLAYDGDANRDGKVDGVDHQIVLSHWGTGTTWDQGNFKGYGVVGAEDEAIWQANVPEPTTLAILAVGAVALRRRRR